MAWRFASQTKSKWYFWKSFETFTRFSFLQKQLVLQNGQHSSLDNVTRGIPEGSLS